MTTDPRAEPIMVLEDGRRLSFVYDDLMRYHGGAMPGGVALACRLMQAVFRRHRAAGGGPPERGACALYSGLGENGPGIIDAVDLVLRLRRHGLLLAAPSGTEPDDAPEAPGGGRYYFELTIGEPPTPPPCAPAWFRRTFSSFPKNAMTRRRGLPCSRTGIMPASWRCVRGWRKI